MYSAAQRCFAVYFLLMEQEMQLGSREMWRSGEVTLDYLTWGRKRQRISQRLPLLGHSFFTLQACTWQFQSIPG